MTTGAHMEYLRLETEIEIKMTSSQLTISDTDQIKRLLYIYMFKTTLILRRLILQLAQHSKPLSLISEFDYIF